MLQSTYKQIGSCLNNMLTQSTIGDSGVGDSSGSVHESPTNQAQFNLIYPNQMLGIQALGIRAVYLLHCLPGILRRTCQKGEISTTRFNYRIYNCMITAVQSTFKKNYNSPDPNNF